MRNKILNWNSFGVLAMLCLHASTVPVLYRVIFLGDFTDLPPADFIFLIWLGLIGMTIRYYYHIRDMLAVISNMWGVYANTVLFIIIMWN